MVPGDDGEGKRSERRAPITLVVEYGDADDLIEDYTSNLSVGGTFVHTEREFEQGTVVDLVLSFPGLLRPIQLAGVVRWASANGGDNGVGIEFVGHDNITRARLQSVIEAIERNDPRFVGHVMRVLLAEDNSHIARLVRNGLTQSGRRSIFHEHIVFDFIEVQEGKDALAMLELERFDMAIINLFLPPPDGFAVIERIREGADHAGMAVLGMSNGGANAAQRALDVGCDYYLNKPFKLQELLEVIRDLLIKRPAAVQSQSEPAK